MHLFMANCNMIRVERNSSTPKADSKEIPTRAGYPVYAIPACLVACNANPWDSMYSFLCSNSIGTVVIHQLHLHVYQSVCSQNISAIRTKSSRDAKCNFMTVRSQGP